jgi:hypothetical protein
MKLEIKHLAPYLPYFLKVQHTTFIEFGKTAERVDYLDCLSSECATFDSYMDYYFDVDDNECEIKPILRPLSDLTKEIEHNGEKFVPIEWFEEKYYTLDLHKQCLRLLEEDGGNWINQSDYMLVQHLIEWHFDIFGLIENNLATDINTIR